MRWTPAGSLAVLFALAAGGACDDHCPGYCEGPTAMQFNFEDQPAATFTVTGACSLDAFSCSGTDCTEAIVDLEQVGVPPNAGPLACHVSATSPDGVVVERDLTAVYISACCPGYIFDADSHGPVAIWFAGADAGRD